MTALNTFISHLLVNLLLNLGCVILQKCQEGFNSTLLSHLSNKSGIRVRSVLYLCVCMFCKHCFHTILLRKTFISHSVYVLSFSLCNSGFVRLLEMVENA